MMDIRQYQFVSGPDKVVPLIILVRQKGYIHTPLLCFSLKDKEESYINIQQCLTLTQPCCQARVALELKYLLTSLSIITSMYHRIIEACQEI